MCGFTIEQAIACTGSTAQYIDWMKWIMAANDPALLHQVIHGHADIFDAAKQVRPMVEMKAMKAAYKKLTPEQRIAWAAQENLDVVFDQVIAPAGHDEQRAEGHERPAVEQAR
jgi:hypothetical protein